MNKDFVGSFSFQKLIIQINAPKKVGVFYCGSIREGGEFVPYFIGHGIIKKQLLNHLSSNWPAVTHFGYTICDTMEEAEALAESEVVTYHPKYNLRDN